MRHMRHRKYGWVDNMWAKEMRAKSKFADFVASGYPPKAVWRSLSPNLSADTGWMVCVSEAKETGDVLISDRGAGCRMVFPFGTLTHQLLLIKDAMGAEGDPLPGLTAILEGIGLDPGDALDSIRMGLIV